jgi:hypothetical protein
MVVGIRIGIGIWGFGDWGLEVDSNACISNSFWRCDRVITSVSFSGIFFFALVWRCSSIIDVDRRSEGGYESAWRMGRRMWMARGEIGIYLSTGGR